jgi:hypothetical protein
MVLNVLLWYHDFAQSPKKTTCLIRKNDWWTWWTFHICVDRDGDLMGISRPDLMRISMGFSMGFMVIFHGIYGGLMESNGIYPAWL